MPELFFLIGLLVVGLVAMVLALTPPDRVGAFASFLRMGVAIGLIALGIFMESRGLTLPAFALAGLGGFLVWRQRMKARKAAAGDAFQGAGPRDVSQETMGREEAYAVLGLSPGAGEEAIRRAHHDLMQKIHPDHGGSSYLAMKLNLARDTLLGRARAT